MIKPPTSSPLPRRFYREILYLLQNKHLPRVEVATSLVSAAGEGVFASQKLQVPAAADSAASSLLPLCLYPGVYTPGLPSFAVGDDSIVYLANELPPPSGILNDDNAYILNISQVGGYFDGLALKGAKTQVAGGDLQQLQSRQLDENPSACAHKINHSSRHANVTILPFYWKDVFQEQRANEDDFFEPPNSMRCDDSPWYFDGGVTNQVCRFKHNQNEYLLCGAAACPLTYLEAGQELLLNYSLKLPYPSWAHNWYDA